MADENKVRLRVSIVNMDGELMGTMIISEEVKMGDQRGKEIVATSRIAEHLENRFEIED